MSQKSHLYLNILALVTMCFASNQAHANTVGPIDCFKKAIAADWRNLDAPSAAGLCSAASSDMPLLCYDVAFSKDGLDFRSSNAVTLCSGTTSLAPIICANEAKGLKLDQENLAALCSGSRHDSIRASINCYKEAYPKFGLNLREAQAATLCGRGKPAGGINY